jgi:hypothetical protein
MTKALIHQGKVHRLYSDEDAKLLHTSLLLVSAPAGCTVGTLYDEKSGAFTAPDPAEAEAEAWKHWRAKALAELKQSDRIVLRCFEADMKVPAAWREYRQKMRDIAGAETGTVGRKKFPARPDKPAF